MEVGTMTNLWNAIRTRRVLVIVIGVLLAAGLGTSAAIFGPTLFTEIQPAKTANSAKGANTANDPAKAIPAGFSELRSQQAGFQLDYPSSWTKLNPQNPQILLLLSQGTHDSLLVRTNQLQDPVGVAQLPTMKQLTDKIVTSNKSVQIVTGPNQIDLGGLPGFYYFYNFTDPASGQQGAHSHFFLFNGKTMISMVFQSLPKEHFTESAKTFDQVVNSFQALKK